MAKDNREQGGMGENPERDGSQSPGHLGSQTGSQGGPRGSSGSQGSSQGQSGRRGSQSGRRSQGSDGGASDSSRRRPGSMNEDEENPE
jgi:hypothetical protein